MKIIKTVDSLIKTTDKMIKSVDSVLLNEGVNFIPRVSTVSEVSHTHSSITLSFTSVEYKDEAIQYRILNWDLGTTSVDWATYSFTNGTTTKTITDLISETEYSFVVQARSSSGKTSSYSNVLTVTTSVQPPANYTLQIPPLFDSDGVTPIVNNANTVGTWGVTWTFSDLVEWGRFCTGDYWVKGPVNITSISPTSQNISGRTMNGAMVNPIPDPIDGSHGYDSGMSTGLSFYESNLNKALNVSSQNPLFLQEDSSVVSTISVPTAGVTPQLKTAAILTVLMAVPSSDSFRPAYVGSDKTIKYNKTDLNYAVLGTLTKVASTPTMNTNLSINYNPSSITKTWANGFARPWIDHIIGTYGRNLHPLDNMPNYGQNMSQIIGDAMLMLNLNFTQAEKESLLVGVVQVGIDLHGMAINGGFWPVQGGQDMGRLLPILFAGKVLGDADMLSAAELTNSNVPESASINPQLPKYLFQELQNTTYVTDLMVSISQHNTPIVWNPDIRDVGKGLIEAYTQADVDNEFPEFSIHYFPNPEQSNRDLEAIDNYRAINASASTSHALASMILNLRDTWNHEAFFGHVDRWFAYTNGTHQYQDVGTFCRDMWNTYRKNYYAIGTTASSGGGWYPTWVTGTYYKFDFVKHNLNWYYCHVSSTTATPGSSSDWVSIL